VLTPSERVKAITEIARRLGQDDWSLIDLTLRQFKLSATDVWQGNDRVAYVMNMIEAATDAILLSLGQHVGYEHQSDRPQVEPDFWRPGYFRLFVTHLAAERAFATQLQAELFSLGISSFVAHNDIEPTREWQDEIEAALASCDSLLALLHPSFHASNWTDQEVGYVMGRGLLIVAVKYGQDPYGFIGRFQALQGQGKDAKTLAREVLDILCSHRQTRKRMAESLVTLLERSDTYAGAKASMDLLDQAQYWDAALTSRLRSAVLSNGQVHDAWGVPQRVEQFIKRMETGT